MRIERFVIMILIKCLFYLFTFRLERVFFELNATTGRFFWKFAWPVELLISCFYFAYALPAFAFFMGYWPDLGRALYAEEGTLFLVYNGMFVFTSQQFDMYYFSVLLLLIPLQLSWFFTGCGSMYRNHCYLGNGAWQHIHTGKIGLSPHGVLQFVNHMKELGISEKSSSTNSRNFMNN